MNFKKIQLAYCKNFSAFSINFLFAEFSYTQHKGTAASKLPFAGRKAWEKTDKSSVGFLRAKLSVSPFAFHVLLLCSGLLLQIFQSSRRSRTAASALTEPLMPSRELLRDR